MASQGIGSGGARVVDRETLKPALDRREFARLPACEALFQAPCRSGRNADYTIGEPSNSRLLKAAGRRKHFVQIHSATIFNVERIVERRPLLHGDHDIELNFGARVTLRRRFRGSVLPFTVGPWPG